MAISIISTLPSASEGVQVSVKPKEGPKESFNKILSSKRDDNTSPSKNEDVNDVPNKSISSKDVNEDKNSDNKDIKSSAKDVEVPKEETGKVKEDTPDDVINKILQLISNGNLNLSKDDLKEVESRLKELKDMIGGGLNELKVLSNFLTKYSLNEDMNKFKGTIIDDGRFYKAFGDSKVNDNVDNVSKSIGEIKSLINDMVKTGAEDSSSVLDKISKILENAIAKTTETKNKSEIKDSVKSILETSVKEEKQTSADKTSVSNNNLQSNTDKGNKSTETNKVDQSNLKTESTEPKKTESTTSDTILKKLAASDDGSNNSKFNTLMTRLGLSDGVKEVNSQNITVNKNNLSSDIIKAVKYMENENIKNLTVKINPKELGEIVIKVTMENGNMKASLQANNKEAYNLLQSSINDLSDKLQESNLKIQNFNVDLFNEGNNNLNQQNSQGESHKKQGNRNISSISETEETNDTEENLLDSQINVYV